MDKKHIITIAGSLGAGKSSTATRVAGILKYSHLSTGDFMRSIAEKRGISLGELSIIAETDDGAIDKEIDDNSRAIRQKSNIVLDSRLGFFFIPESFKVLLELNPRIAAERILNDAKHNPNRNKETPEGFDSVDSVIKSINKRKASEQKRYYDLYGIVDNTARENFDLVINTSTIPLKDVANKIVKEYKNWLNK